MTTQSDVKTLPGIIATGDLSSKQFLFVKNSSTSNAVKIVAATTDIAVGILQNKPENLEDALVGVGGYSKLVAGTSVGWTAGVAVGWNTTGKGVPLAANSTNDNRLVMGRYHTINGQTTTVVINQIIGVQMFPAAQRL